MSSNIEQHLDIDPCEMDEDQNAAIKIADMEAKYEKEIAELTTKLEQSELEKKAAVAISVKALAQVAEAGASPPTPVSAKKIIYTDAMHKTTHAKVVALTAPALLELKKLENNYEAIWWCVKHAEALIKGDRTDGFDKYCTWGNKNMTAAALQAYMPLATEALAAGSP
jgi:hypothetical protein